MDKKKIRAAINGFGRIGRAFLKLAMNEHEIEVVAVNDLGDINNLAYLLRHDSVYGNFQLPVTVEENSLVVGGKKIAFVSEKDTSKLPWKKFDIDVVVESTGLFVSYELAKFHLDQGAKRVVITAPAKGEGGPVKGETILMGVNEERFGKCEITSNASCTTNAASPLIAILHEALGIEKAILNTVHAYTASQGIVDGPNKRDAREGRAAAQNTVPSSTGAAIAVTKAFPALDGLFDGVAIRVPVVCGSIVDVTFISKKETSAHEVNDILKRAAGDRRWEKVFAVTEEPLVSSDIIGETHASVADLLMTRVVGGNLVKVLAWYDNEMGYTHTLVDHVIKTGASI